MGMLRPLPSPSPAASTTTALQALLAPEYDIIHVAGDVVAGFVGACFFFFFLIKNDMPLWFVFASVYRIYT